MRYIMIIMLLAVSVSAYAKTKLYVSILPQKFFVESIAGDKADVSVMVLPGASPATYEPKPKQMVDLSSTDIYFSIGAPFEQTWLPKFAEMNKKMTIVHTDEGIKKRNVEKHVHEHDEHGHDEHDDHGGLKDPHIWLDPILVIKQAEAVTSALCAADSANCAFYNKNKDNFIRSTDLLHSELEKVFKGKKDLHFMVFHPSWGYFADRYGLHQIPVELEGKEPKPSDLKEFITLVKQMGLKTIFIQPQFSKKAAELIATETGATVTVANPLAEDWDKNLLHVAHLIADNL